MKKKWVSNTFIFWLVTVAVLFVTHRFVTVSLFSIVPWPLTLALVLAFTTKSSLRILLVLVVGAELFSALPPGFMAVALCLPFLVTSVVRRVTPDISFTFFAYVLLIAAGQVVIVGLGQLLVLWQQGVLRGWHDVLTFLPLPAAYMIGGVSITAMIFIIIWNEFIAPYQVERTIPRFKQL